MASAIVLAGGRSRRFGRDKASAMLVGRPLLQHVLDRVAPLVDELIVVTRAGQVLPAIEGHEFRRVDDLLPDRGPLGGLYTGLLAASSWPALAVGCDTPLLQPALLRELLGRQGAEAVVPRRAGLPEGLVAAYAKSTLPAIHSRLERGELKLASLLDDLKVEYIEEQDWRRLDPEGLSFLNLNSEAELRAAGGRLIDNN